MISKIVRITAPKKFSQTTVSIPGSKSITNRALILASFFHQSILLKGALISEDTELMIAGLRELGVGIENVQHGILINPYTPSNDVIQIDAGLAGTTSRFLTSVCAFLGRKATIFGREKLLTRPIYPLVDSLKSFGAEISYLGRKGSIPLRIQAKTLLGNIVTVDSGVSSQYISALLLGAYAAKREIEIQYNYQQSVSQSYIHMTVELLRSFGSMVSFEKGCIRIERYSKPQKDQFIIEPDATSASYFGAISLLSNQIIRVSDLSFKSAQGEMLFFEYLRGSGVQICDSQSGLIVHPIDEMTLRNVSMNNAPDSALTLAVLVAGLSKSITISGLSTLKNKESDRLTVLKGELEKLGGAVTITSDSITIHKRKLHSGRVSTYDDHRIAMAFSILSTVLPYIEIENPDVVKKSYPGYFSSLMKLGYTLEEVL